MNLGTESRKKTIAALVLVTFALILVVYRIFNPAGSPPQAASTQAVQPMAAPASTASRPAARRTATSKKSPAPSLDPTLKLDLLRSSEDTKYSGAGRNIFRAQEIVIPKPVKSPVKNIQQAQVPPQPPPPPPINLRFFGFANKPGEPKKIFLSQGDDVFIAGEGDIVNRRYKVLRIGPSSVEIEDVLNNNRQQIPLTQG